MTNQNSKNPVLKALASFFNTIISLFTFGKSKNTGKSILQEEAISSPSKTIVKNFVRNKLALIGLAALISMTLFVFGGSQIVVFDVLSNDWSHRNLPPSNNLLRVPRELSRVGVQDIASGRGFSIALDKNGNLHGWGVNLSGVLDFPQEVRNATIVKIGTGDEHVLALSSTGELFAWGSNTFNQATVSSEIRNVLRNDRAVDIGGGDIYSYVVTDSGRLYVWGATLANNLGNIPSRIQGQVLSAGASSSTMLLVSKNNRVLYHGARGTLLANVPEHLTNGNNLISKVVATTHTGLALDQNGFIHQWGHGGDGLRNIPDSVNFAHPNRKRFVDIQAGRRHFIALSEDGNVYAWGDNAFNQISVPTSLRQGRTVAIFSDYFQNYAVLEDNSIVTWGLNGFFFGTDENGNNIFARLIHGGRITMTVGAVAVLISTFLGVLVGLISGFYGKWIDNVLMRFAEIINSFPFLPLAITLSSFLTGQLTQNERILMIMVILGLIGWPGLARLVRGQILAEREKEFVLAARALGIRSKIVIIRHILPNVINLIIVSMTLSYAGSLLTEAGLSFLGFGVAPPSPSWGNMLTGAQQPEVIQFFWWRWVFPAIAVLFTALSVNLVGDGLREAMDPRANEK